MTPPSVLISPPVKLESHPLPSRPLLSSPSFWLDEGSFMVPPSDDLHHFCAVSRLLSSADLVRAAVMKHKALRTSGWLEGGAGTGEGGAGTGRGGEN